MSFRIKGNITWKKKAEPKMMWEEKYNGMILNNNVMNDEYSHELYL